VAEDHAFPVIHLAKELQALFVEGTCRRLVVLYHAGSCQGGVACAQQWVSSGFAAIDIATIPLWTTLFLGIWRRWPRRREWFGLVIGFAGVLLLNVGGAFRASPLVPFWCSSLPRVGVWDRPGS